MPLCTQCNKNYVKLQDHIERVHQKIRYYHCDCGKSFYDKKDYDIHQYTHTGEENFICTWENENGEKCGKTFKQSTHLRVHVRRHEGDKRYPCDMCEAKFVTKGDLRVHLNTANHLNIKSIVCETCNKPFASHKALSKHRQLHTGGRFPCTETDCSKVFTDKRGLESHHFYYHTPEGNARMRHQEERIRRLLLRNNISFEPQHTIDFTCMKEDEPDGSRCYIDFLVEIRDDNDKVSGYIFLEVDEDQHRSYGINCELRRMTDVSRTLIMEGNTLPVAFIRYNPDTLEIDGVKQKVKKCVREANLLQLLQTYAFDRPFCVEYLYYDMLEDLPSIFYDDMYENSFKELVRFR